MPRAKGAKTLVITESDSTRLDALCASYDDAEKAWLGQLFLRYGMDHAPEAIRAGAEAAAKRIEDERRGAKT